MAWVKFTTTFWHRFTPQMKRRYPAGTIQNVPREVASKAVADGFAIRMKKPSKAADPEVDNAEAGRG